MAEPRTKQDEEREIKQGASTIKDARDHSKEGTHGRWIAGFCRPCLQTSGQRARNQTKVGPLFFAEQRR